MSNYLAKIRKAAVRQLASSSLLVPGPGRYRLGIKPLENIQWPLAMKKGKKHYRTAESAALQTTQSLSNDTDISSEKKLLPADSRIPLRQTIIGVGLL